MSNEGFGLYWNGVYWVSLTISRSADRTRDDVYFGPVGEDSHHHSWLKWTHGELAELGASLKDAAFADRLPAAFTTGLSTETLATFSANYDPLEGTVTTVVADVYSGTEYVSAASVSKSTGSKRHLPQVEVDVPENTRRIEGEIAYCRTFGETGLTKMSTDAGFPPISADGSVGISVQITKRSTD